MSDFFKSDVVRAELAEINRLQEDIYSNMISFDNLSQEVKLDNLSLLEELIDKQQIMWTRLSLATDDPDAVKMKDQIQASAVMMGFQKNTDVGVLFSNMRRTLEEVRSRVDKDSSAS